MGSKLLVEPAAFIFFRVEDVTSSFFKNEFYIFYSMHYDTIVTLQINQIHTLLYNYNNVLIYINIYTFWASLVHHQGVQS